MATAAEDSAERAATDEGPLRTCAVTRREDQPDNLIRFVAGPDGAIVPDIACRLPGRGVWLSLDRRIVEQAVKTRAFNRSLKREVSAAPELADLVQRLLTDRVLSSLSLCNKAGLALAGFTKIETGINEGSIAVLLHADVAGADGVEKLDRRYLAMCRDADRTPFIVRTFTNEQMSLALGRANVVHAALKMGGAARHFMIQSERLEKYRSGTADGG